MSFCRLLSAPVLFFFLALFPCSAQDQPAQKPEKPGIANPVVVVDDKPVTALPYTPSLNEPEVEKLGATPLKPALDAIAALKSKKDLAALLGREHLANATEGLFFGFGSDQDFADSNQVIAFAVAGGLGLPDRDYYTKPEPQSEEIRQKYLV